VPKNNIAKNINTNLSRLTEGHTSTASIFLGV
jgi:hypothetical protein